MLTMKFIRLLSILLLALLCACTGDEPEWFPQPSDIQISPGEKIWCGFDPEAEYLAVVGDVQAYVENKHLLPYFKNQCVWLIKEKKRGAPLNFVMYTGDLTNDNSDKQWRRFYYMASPVAEVIPSVGCPGNHDYSWSRRDDNYMAIRSRLHTLYNSWGYLPGMPARIIDSFEPDRIDNIILADTIADRRIDIISLEFGPRPEVLQWASAHVSAHPERRYLLLTHEMLTAEGKLLVGGGFAKEQFAPYGVGYSNPDQVVSELVAPNPNIILVVCGHNGHSATTMVKNSAGEQVPIILYNLQYIANGGDSEVQLLKFSRKENQVQAAIINTQEGKLPAVFEPYFSFTYR